MRGGGGGGGKGVYLLGNEKFTIHTSCQLNAKKLFPVHKLVLMQKILFEIIQYKQTLHTYSSDGTMLVCEANYVLVLSLNDRAWVQRNKHGIGNYLFIHSKE